MATPPSYVMSLYSDKCAPPPWRMARSFCCVGPQGSVVTYCAENREEESLTLHRLHETGSNWRFKSTRGPSLAAAGGKRLLVACQTALDELQGVKVPCIVASRPDNGSEVEILALSGKHDCDTLISCGTVRVLDCAVALECGFQILDGPTVIWSEEETICVGLRRLESTSPRQSLTQHTINMNKFTKQNHVIDQFWCLNWPDGTVLLFVRLSASASSQQAVEPTAHWLCLSLSKKRDGRDIGVEKLPPHCYVPGDYGCIATCIAAHFHWHVRREGDVFLEADLLVGTQYLQVVLLRGGIPLHCVTVETIPSELAIIDVPGSDDVVTFAVRTANKEVTAYRVSAEGEPWEVRRWEGVANIIVGDFADLTRDQLLVLFTNNSEEISDFTVTDLAHFTIGSQARGMDATSSSLPPSQSLVSAVKALHVRQRVGEAHLMDVQRELQLKTELLRDSLQLLQSLTSGPSPTHHAALDQSLVCVLPGKVESAEGSVGVSDSTHNKPVVTECWQRLLNGCWTVGVALKNPTSCVWHQLSLALVVDDVLLTETGGSSVVWVHSSLDGGDSCKQPANKRLKTEEGVEEKKVEDLLVVGMEKTAGLLQRHSVPPGSEACLVAWVTLPAAEECQRQSGVLSGGLVFSWRERGGRCEGVRGVKCDSVRVVEVGRMELPVRYLTDSSLKCDWQCLQHWNGEGDMLGQWRNFRHREIQDLACLLATQHITHLTVSSQFTDLGPLAATLRQRLPLPSHRILPGTSPHATPSATGDGMETGSVLSGTGTKWEGECSELDGVHLYTSGCGHTASISILHRNSSSLSIMLSAIHGCLPDDLTFSPPHSSHTHCHTSHIHHCSSHITGQQTQIVQLCVTAMRKEVERRREEVEREMGERREKGEDVKEKGEEGREIGERREKGEVREEGGRRVRGEEGRVDYGLLEAMEETDYAMFRAMQSLHM